LNGIVSVFVRTCDQRLALRPWGVFLTLFMVPFVVIGWVIGEDRLYVPRVVHPRPKLMVTPGAVPLAETFTVQWDITGRTKCVGTPACAPPGTREATYRRGTDTTTDRKPVPDLEIANVTTRLEMRSGSGTVTIPASLMHSFHEHKQQSRLGHSGPRGNPALAGCE